MYDRFLQGGAIPGGQVNGTARPFWLPSNCSSWLDACHPDDRPEIETTLKHAINETCQFDMVYRMRTKGGEYKWMHDKGFVIYDEEEIVIIGVMTDVTELQQVKKITCDG
jgi:PAS domain-containing protein